MFGDRFIAAVTCCAPGHECRQAAGEFSEVLGRLAMIVAVGEVAVS